MFYNRKEGKFVHAYIAGIALDILFLLFFFIAVYYFLLGIFSFFPEREEKKENREFTFAVLIPAQ